MVCPSFALRPMQALTTSQYHLEIERAFLQQSTSNTFSNFSLVPHQRPYKPKPSPSRTVRGELSIKYTHYWSRTLPLAITTLVFNNRGRRFPEEACALDIQYDSYTGTHKWF